MLSGLAEIISFSMGSLIWGVLIAIIFVALFFVIISNWYKNMPLTPVSYIICAILFLILAFHCVFIVGEIKIISSADDYKAYIQQIFNMLNIDGNMWIKESEAKPVLDSLFDHYPLLQHYLCDYSYEGTVAQMPNSMIDYFVSLVKEELLYDILWCLGAVIVASILVILSMRDGKPGKGTPKRSYTPSEDVF